MKVWKLSTFYVMFQKWRKQNYSQAKVTLPVDVQWISVGTKDWYEILTVYFPFVALSVLTIECPLPAFLYRGVRVR